jgi:two-component system chemotaxis response regulator CheY
MTKTVLTVDDSRTMRDMLMLALKDAGYRVVQAEDGVHGLEVLQADNPDIVITDINMPRMDGFGFIEGMRADPAFSAVPVLVLTTESDAAKKQRAKQVPQSMLDELRMAAMACVPPANYPAK